RAAAAARACVRRRARRAPGVPGRAARRARGSRLLVELLVVGVDPLAVARRHLPAALRAEDVARVLGQVAPALARVRAVRVLLGLHARRSLAGRVLAVAGRLLVALGAA